MPGLVRWLLRLGPTNPVAVRLVHGGSSRSRHMVIRTGYLAALIGVLLWSLLVQASPGLLSYRDLAAAGAKSFAVTAYLQIALICLLAPLFMAGAIAQEANPKTWEILLTTPLSAGQIVLGNLLGRLFFILALLLSSLPLFAITQYFGGVPGGAIFQSYAVAACAALLVGSIAIALSVSRVAGRRAVLLFYIAVVTYLAVTWAIDRSMRAGWGGVTPITALNPFLAQESLLSPASYPRPEATELAAMSGVRRLWMGSPVAAWCLWSSLVSVVLMGAATAAVRTIAMEGGSLWKRMNQQNGRERSRALRSVWKNPVAWREATTRAATLPKRIARWSFLGAGILWGVGLLWTHNTGQMTAEALRFALLATVLAELMVIALLAMNMASTSVSREREDGTLDLLLTTPLTPRAYLGGKVSGLISFLVPLLAVPYATVAMAAVYVLADGFGASRAVTIQRYVGASQQDVPLMLPIAAIALPLLATPFIAFCVTVGLQWSVKSKGTIGAAVATIGVVAAVTGVIGLCGWQAGREVAFVGPILACLNPATALYILFDPAGAAQQTIQSAGGVDSVSLSMISGAAVALVVYGVIVWAMLTSMVRSFDMTVRRLAGTR